MMIWLLAIRKLLDMDLFSRSDPMCVVYHHPTGASHWVELLRTEVIWDCLDPDFVTKVHYSFLSVLSVMLSVFAINFKLVC